MRRFRILALVLLLIASFLLGRALTHHEPKFQPASSVRTAMEEQPWQLHRKQPSPASLGVASVTRTPSKTAHRKVNRASRTRPRSGPVASAETSSSVWARLAQCESGGNPSTNTGNGFYGMYQFDLQTWHSVGGTGYPHHASVAEQTKRAKILQSRRGWSPWPACSRKLGLR